MSEWVDRALDEEELQRQDRSTFDSRAANTLDQVFEQMKRDVEYFMTRTGERDVSVGRPSKLQVKGQRLLGKARDPLEATLTANPDRLGWELQTPTGTARTVSINTQQFNPPEISEMILRPVLFPGLPSRQRE